MTIANLLQETLKGILRDSQLRQMALQKLHCFWLLIICTPVSSMQKISKHEELNLVFFNDRGFCVSEVKPQEI